jgi:hypothetical protein
VSPRTLQTALVFILLKILTIPHTLKCDLGVRFPNTTHGLGAGFLQSLQKNILDVFLAPVYHNSIFQICIIFFKFIRPFSFSLISLYNFLTYHSIKMAICLNLCKEASEKHAI